ncbi:MAG: hypothetical protein K8F59_07660 [Rhodobacteraceae bacterium]|nr:hypothetical protein [Paracoccaceae bacterium]
MKPAIRHMLRRVARHAALLLALPGVALADGASDAPMVDVALISGWQDSPTGPVGALKVTLAPGWKTYWRVGGQSGFPPVFDWAGSENLAGVAFDWPRPELIETEAGPIIGYANQLILPIRFLAKIAGQPVTARATLDLGVCRDVCVPVSTELSLRLGEGSSAERFLIDLALADQPQDAAAAGMARADCTLHPVRDGIRLTASLNLPRSGSGGEEVVFELPRPDLWLAPSASRRDGDHLIAETTVLSLDGEAFAFDAEALRITIIDRHRAVEFNGCNLPG